MNPFRFDGHTNRRPWRGTSRRCRSWQLGPFGTDWRCVLRHDHAEVEGLGHIYEPDLWPGGSLHKEWVARCNPFVDRSAQ